MPMIEAKVTVNLPEEKRNVLKAELGKAITIIGKPESYLMINIIGLAIFHYDLVSIGRPFLLYFRGNVVHLSVFFVACLFIDICYWCHNRIIA